MGRKIKISRTLALISVLTVFAGIVYGCYSRDVAQQAKNIYGQNVKPVPVSDEELRRFAGTVRKVDGEAESHYKMALYFQERNRHKLAIDELKQVLKRDPASAKAYNAIGVSCDKLGDIDTAIDNYRKALQIDPKLDYVYNNLGYSCLLKNDTQQAVESFRQAIAINGKEKRYSNNLGLAYARQGNYDSALAQFKSTDSDANAEKMLARVMNDLGKGAEVEVVLAAVRNAPEKEVAVAMASGSSEIPVRTVLPEAVPQSIEVAVAEIKPAEPPVVVAEAKLEEPPVVVAEVKQENVIVVAEVKAETPKEVIAEVIPETPRAVVAEVKLEELPVVAAEVKQEEPKVVVAEAKLEEPPVVVAEVKFEEPPVVVAKVKPEIPVIDTAPAAPQNQEEILIAAVKPVDVKPDTKFVIMENGKSDPGFVSANSRPLEGDNPVLPNTIQVHEVRILESAPSTQASGQKAVLGKAFAGTIAIAVENGNGVKGAAGRMAELLRRKGFNVVKVSDARSFDHFSTKVFFEADNIAEVHRLLRVIPKRPESAELFRMEKVGPPPIRLLVGKDQVKKETVLAQEKKPAPVKTALVGNLNKLSSPKKKKV